MTNAMLDPRSGTQGNAMLWDGPKPQQPWYRQPGYRPTNFMLDAANKAAGVVSDFVWPILRGDLHKAANEYELGGRGEQELPKQAFDAAGGVMMGSFGAKAPVGSLRSGAAQSEYRTLKNRLSNLNAERQIANMTGDKEKAERIAVEIQNVHAMFDKARNKTELTEFDGVLEARNKHGQVYGTSGNDPQIGGAYVSSPGKGEGQKLYKQWADHVGRPFRSDTTVTDDAAFMYSKKFPEWGYRVSVNPRARKMEGGYMAPSGEHVYRVEPPGQHTTRNFYSNPFSGSVVPMYVGDDE